MSRLSRLATLIADHPLSLLLACHISCIMSLLLKKLKIILLVKPHHRFTSPIKFMTFQILRKYDNQNKSNQVNIPNPKSKIGPWLPMFDLCRNIFYENQTLLTTFSFFLIKNDVWLFVNIGITDQGHLIL